MRPGLGNKIVDSKSRRSIGHLAVLVLAVGLHVSHGELLAGESKTPNVRPTLERRLTALSLPSTVEGVYRFLQSQVPDASDLKGYERLIGQFSSSSFKERETAAQLVISVGPRILPSLINKSEHDSDAETRKRCRACILAIARGGDLQLFADINTAVLVLGEFGEGNTVEVLLRAMQWIPDLSFHANTWWAVEGITSRKKVDWSLLATFLSSLRPDLRSIGAFNLIRHGTGQERVNAVKLLRDDSTVVRLRTAQALLSVGDAAALPVLVEMLTHESFAINLQAEELLRWWYGRQAPELTIQHSDAAKKILVRKKWDELVSSAGLEKKRDTTNGPPPFLVVVSDASYLGSSTEEAVCGSDGKVRWRLPFHGRSRLECIVNNGNLVMTEWSGQLSEFSFRLVERDFNRQEYWSSNAIAVDPKGRKTYPRCCSCLLDYFFVTADDRAVRIVTRDREQIANWEFNYQSTDALIAPEGFVHGHLQCSRTAKQGNKLAVVDRPLFNVWSGKINGFRSDFSTKTSRSLLESASDRFSFDRQTGCMYQMQRNGKLDWKVKLPSTRTAWNLFPILTVGFVEQEKLLD